MARKNINTTLDESLYAQIKKIALETGKNTNDVLEDAMRCIIVQHVTQEHKEHDPLEEEYVRFLEIPAIELEIWSDSTTTEFPSALIEKVSMIRKNITMELGFLIPKILMTDNKKLQTGEYRIWIKGNEVAAGRIYPERWMLVRDRPNEHIEGIPAKDPIYHLPALWITEEWVDQAVQEGEDIIDPLQVMLTHLTEVIRRYAWELLGRQETKQLIDLAKKHAPAVVEDLHSRAYSLANVQWVLQRLLQEKVSIRYVPTILETLTEQPASTKDLIRLTEKVRRSLRRSIVLSYVNEDKKLEVYEVGSVLENEISRFLDHSDTEIYFRGIVEDDYQERYEQVVRVFKQAIPHSKLQMKKPIFLCSGFVRPLVRFLVQSVDYDYETVVLAHEELIEGIEVDVKGTVTRDGLFKR